TRTGEEEVRSRPLPQRGGGALLRRRRQHGNEAPNLQGRHSPRLGEASGCFSAHVVQGRRPAPLPDRRGGPRRPGDRTYISTATVPMVTAHAMRGLHGTLAVDSGITS